MAAAAPLAEDAHHLLPFLNTNGIDLSSSEAMLMNYKDGDNYKELLQRICAFSRDGEQLRQYLHTLRVSQQPEEFAVTKVALKVESTRTHAAKFVVAKLATNGNIGFLKIEKLKQCDMEIFLDRKELTDALVSFKVELDQLATALKD